MKMRPKMIKPFLYLSLLLVFLLPVASVFAQSAVPAADDQISLQALVELVLSLWPQMDMLARGALVFVAVYVLLTQFIGIGRRYFPQQFDQWTWDEWIEAKLGVIAPLPKIIIGMLTANYGRRK